MALPPLTTTQAARRRDERGVAFPSPLVMLSVLAVAMAGIAFVLTGDTGNTDGERDITVVSRPQADPATEQGGDRDEDREKAAGKHQDRGAKEQRKDRTRDKPVRREEVPVVVFNNSGVGGLAGRTATKAQDIGWHVVGADNWYGTIPATTVYFPERLQRAARTLARDLGIDRVQPAVDPMRMDRLTVVLTADYS